MDSPDIKPHIISGQLLSTDPMKTQQKVRLFNNDVGKTGWRKKLDSCLVPPTGVSSEQGAAARVRLKDRQYRENEPDRPLVETKMSSL